MADHELVEPAPPADVSRVVDVKVIAASVATLGAGITVGVLNAVQADNTVLAGLPPWLQFLILAALPPSLTFFSGYWKTSNRV